MEKICIENIISGLMFIGFDKVDSLLLNYTTEAIFNSGIYAFKFDDDAIVSLYNYIDIEDNIFKFKEGESLNSIVTSNKVKDLPMKTLLALHSNKKIIEVLKTIDFKKIILRKISSIGINNLSEMNYLFSSKEKEIIMNIFGITLNSNEKGLRK